MLSSADILICFHFPEVGFDISFRWYHLETEMSYPIFLKKKKSEKNNINLSSEYAQERTKE